MCIKHYRRWATHGDVERVDRVQGDPVHRFLSQVDKGDGAGCWLWSGSGIERNGYARFMVDGKRVGVHRWAYGHFVRPLLPGEVVDHLCEVRHCANPAHLLAGSQRSNVLRAVTSQGSINRAKTHCKREHELAGENLVIAHDGSRQCRECRNMRARESQRRRRAAR